MQRLGEPPPTTGVKPTATPTFRVGYVRAGVADVPVLAERRGVRDEEVVHAELPAGHR